MYRKPSPGVTMMESAQDRVRTDGADCRFQKLDSCVPVMQSAQYCMCDDVPEALDRAPVWCIFSERNMRPVIIENFARIRRRCSSLSTIR